MFRVNVLSKVTAKVECHNGPKILGDLDQKSIISEMLHC